MVGAHIRCRHFINILLHYVAALQHFHNILSLVIPTSFDLILQDSSHISGEEYERLKIEATSWLNNQMYKAVKDAGLQAMMSGAARYRMLKASS